MESPATIERDPGMGGALKIQAKIVTDNVTSITVIDTGRWRIEQRPAETEAEPGKFGQIVSRPTATCANEVESRRHL
jgi:hypothetical protein